MKIINNFTDFINEAKTSPKDIVISLLNKNIERGATLPEQNSAFSKAKMIIHNSGFTRHDFRMFSDEILDLVFGKKPKSLGDIVNIGGFDYKKIKFKGLGDILVDDEFGILSDYIKSTRFLLNDFINKHPLRLVIGKYDNVHFSWLVSDDSDRMRCFFFGDDDHDKNLIGGFYIEEIDNIYLYSNTCKSIMKDNGYKHILVIKPSGKF